MNILNNRLFKKLILLKLPSSDFAVFGSGLLFVYGLIDGARDVDLIARGAAWEKAAKIQKSEICASGKGMVIKLFDGNVKVFNEWSPGEWDTNELIDTAETIEGIKFVTLENVLKWKKLKGKEKDLTHIKLIEEFLKVV